MDTTVNMLHIVQKKLDAMWGTTARMIPNFILAVLVFVIFLFIARLAKRFFNPALLRVLKNSSIANLTANILYTVLFCIGLFTALDILRLDKAVTSLLAGAGIAGLALGFAFQDLTSNFISGIYIAVKRPFEIGDIIQTGDYTGTIESIELRSTGIRTLQGLHLLVPNKDIFQKAVINYSKTAERRVDVDFILPVASHSPALENKVIAAIQQISSLRKETAINWYLTDIDPANLKIKISFWVTHAEQPELLEMKNYIIRRILQAMSETMEGHAQ